MDRAERIQTASGPSAVGRLIRWSAATSFRALTLVAALLAATGAADYATGYRYAFSPFYLLPVLIASAAFGRVTGTSVALTAAAVWTLSQEPPWTPAFSAILFVWNTLMRFLVLGSVAWLLGVLEHEMQDARRDYLTRLFNRRHFMEWLEAERVRSRRSGRPFSVLSVDVDRFKALNDSRGHAVGDDALRCVARVLAACARAMDVPARVGGDEFCLLLPETDEETARVVVHRLAEDSSREFRHRGWPIALSIGVATARGSTEGAEDVLSRADKAMYREKRRHVRPSAG